MDLAILAVVHKCGTKLAAVLGTQVEHLPHLQREGWGLQRAQM